MALSSMLLGHWTRPPYCKVLLRFCSQALAMPVKINSVINAERTPEVQLGEGDTLVHFGTDWWGWHRRPGGTSAGTASERQSSGGRLSGCTAASIPSDSCPCTKTHMHKIQAGLAVVMLGVKSVGVVRFGAGVGCYLLHQLAVGFILNQPMFAT